MSSVGRSKARSVLITGASGFIGRALCRSLAANGYPVRALARQEIHDPDVSFQCIESLRTIDRAVFDGIGAVVHLAGRAHAPGMKRAEQENVFAADADITADLAETAARSGVRRFVFVSTAKVLGEESDPSAPFTHESEPMPGDAYARHKLRAEERVREIAERHGMEWVVVRPVLVYGEGVKGNLATLLRWLSSGYPLPLGGLDNQRSLIARDDLNALLRVCIDNPAANGQRLLAAGDEALSTPQICDALATGLGGRARLVRLPAPLWSLTARIPVTAGKVQRLGSSFVVDNRHTRALTGWTPKVPAAEGLAAVGRWYARLSH